MARSRSRIRSLLWRRLRWVAVAAIARLLVRRAAGRQVDQAAAEIEERLPAPIRSALETLPRNPVRAGGGLVVAGRNARRLATGTGRAARVANDGRRRVAEVNATRPRLGSIRRAIGDDLARESERSRRELRADYLRATVGDAQADEALLDLRDEPLDQRNGPSLEPPEPVRSGRWRAPRRVARHTVDRVQRTYRRPTRPWDR